MTDIHRAAERLDALPEGTVTGTAGVRRFVASKTAFNAGKSCKIVAEELGGPDYISLNCYRLNGVSQLRPCEMPLDKVVAFLCDFVPD